MAQDMTAETTEAFALPESVTIREVSDVYQNLTAAMRHPVGIVVDCSGVREADITLFQMLASAKLSATNAGTALILNWPADGRLRDLLHLSGLSERLN